MPSCKHIKSIATVFVLCGLSSHVLSQSFATRFIEQKKVQWAAWVTDTAHFSDPNLSLLLRKRFEKDEIKAVRSFSLQAIDAVKKSDILFIKKEALTEYMNESTFNENGNLSATPPPPRIDLFSKEKFGSNVNDMVEFEQIFYVESGRLKNFVWSVSPKLNVITPQGTFLGISNLFTTAINTNRRLNRSIRKKAIPLGTSNTSFSLQNDSGFHMLKKMYNRNLLESLWPQIGSDHYEIISIDSSRRISKENISAYIWGNTESMMIPVYDADGNISSTAGSMAVEANHFSAVSFTQNWFYNAKKNILFSNVSSMTLFIFRPKATGEKAVETPVLKINIK